MAVVPVCAGSSFASPRLRGEADALGSALARLSAAGEGDSPRVQLLPLMPKQPLTPTLSP
ncbi:hypothetical protein M2232_004899 [Bradyrhizobium japonicum]|nr:hypothetical protein [Bradyrhizobium japonicum]MCW2345979.1 hypothetical protein [Bradyrhizobium japonicum]